MQPHYSTAYSGSQCRAKGSGEEEGIRVSEVLLRTRCGQLNWSCFDKWEVQPPLVVRIVV